MLGEESTQTILLPTHPTSLTGGLLGCCGRSLHGLHIQTYSTHQLRLVLNIQNDNKSIHESLRYSLDLTPNCPLPSSLVKVSSDLSISHASSVRERSPLYKLDTCSLTTYMYRQIKRRQIKSFEQACVLKVSAVKEHKLPYLAEYRTTSNLTNTRKIIIMASVRNNQSTQKYL